MNVSSARSIVPFAFVAAALLATAVTSAGAKAQQIKIAEQLYPGAVEGDRGPADLGLASGAIAFPGTRRSRPRRLEGGRPP